MAQTEYSAGKLVFMALTRLGSFLLILYAIVLGVAGTLSYWQAWAYMVTLLVPMTVALFYLIRKDPALLARRMQFREKEAPQKKIIKYGSLLYVFIFILPALGQRYNWTDVPAVISIVADVIVLIGYAAFVWVIRVNSYASRTVEVVEGQELISTGPYAIVRHPMYTGNILLYIATPVALGSWWGLIPVVLFIPLMVYRIRNEEEVLLRDLAGYDEYIKDVPYRLLPGIW